VVASTGGHIEVGRRGQFAPITAKDIANLIVRSAPVSVVELALRRIPKAAAHSLPNLLTWFHYHAVTGT
jgi:hypothetical protein